MPRHRTGLLIVRAWVEPGSTEPLRAHLRVMDDIEVEAERNLTLAQPTAVAELVEVWLQSIVDGAARTPAGEAN